MEIILILLIIGSIIYFLSRVEKSYSFNYFDDAAEFNGQLIAYDHLIKIERDISYNHGSSINFGYIVAHYNEQWQVDSIRIYIRSTDQGKWNGFKGKLTGQHSMVVIDERSL